MVKQLVMLVMMTNSADDCREFRMNSGKEQTRMWPNVVPPCQV